MESISDILARIKYRLRHEPITDGFVESLSETVSILRSRYKTSQHTFKIEDIKFLKQLAMLIPKLEEFISLSAAAKKHLQEIHFTQNLSSTKADIESFSDDCFSFIAEQLDIKINAALNLTTTPPLTRP